MAQESFSPQCMSISQQGDLNANTRDTQASFENHQLSVACCDGEAALEGDHPQGIYCKGGQPQPRLELGELQPRGHDSFLTSSSLLLAFLTRKGLADLGHGHAPLLSPGSLPAGIAWCPALPLDVDVCLWKAGTGNSIEIPLQKDIDFVIISPFISLSHRVALKSISKGLIHVIYSAF